MKCMIKKILVTSISLLMIHTAQAQPISDSSLTLVEGLSCLDWAEKEQSFSNKLALGDRTDIKTTQVFQQYPHLKVFNGEVFQNQKLYTPKQIYIYSQLYKRNTSDLNDMIAFISLYNNPLNSSENITVWLY